MPAIQVTVLDYGLGNLFSVCRALEHCGADIRVTDRPIPADSIERLVVPGVGAFADCINGLKRQHLFDTVLRFATTGRPLLGICVGMQMLFDSSEEFGNHQGLGLIPGHVRAIPATGNDGRPHRLPRIGWSPLDLAGEATQGGLLANIRPGQAVYFVHSFMAVPENDRDRSATYDYDGQTITAAIQRDNLHGVQFHPERSGPVGLSIISRFLHL